MAFAEAVFTTYKPATALYPARVTAVCHVLGRRHSLRLPWNPQCDASDNHRAAAIHLAVEKLGQSGKGCISALTPTGYVHIFTEA